MAARPAKRKAEAETTPPANSSGTSDPAAPAAAKDSKKLEIGPVLDKDKSPAAPDPLAEAQRWFALAIAEHNQRRQALEAERQAWESERQWMVSNIRQIPEEDEVRSSIHCHLLFLLRTFSLPGHLLQLLSFALFV